MQYHCVGVGVGVELLEAVTVIGLVDPKTAPVPLAPLKADTVTV